MKDLGILHYLLGIEVACSSRGYLLSQSKYVASVLKQAHISYERSVYSLHKLYEKYSPFNVPHSDLTMYRTLVGTYLYHTIIIPDIAYAIMLSLSLLFLQL